MQDSIGDAGAASGSVVAALVVRPPMSLDRDCEAAAIASARPVRCDRLVLRSRSSPRPCPVLVESLCSSACGAASIRARAGHFAGQLDVGLRAGAVEIVDQHRLAVRRRLGDPDVARDHGVVDGCRRSGSRTSAATWSERLLRRSNMVSTMPWICSVGLRLCAHPLDGLHQLASGPRARRTRTAAAPAPHRPRPWRSRSSRPATAGSRSARSEGDLVRRGGAAAPRIASRNARRALGRARARRRTGRRSRPPHAEAGDRRWATRRASRRARRSAPRRSRSAAAPRSMPRPVEALPWGSRSMISTRSPTAASAVAEIDRGRGLADAALLVGHRDGRAEPDPERRCYRLVRNRTVGLDMAPSQSRPRPDRVAA